MSKLLCIVGPTATGKTALAQELSRRQPSTLISADSRQVYRGMDIVTGKDHFPDTPFYGLDLVSPDQSCSVSIWYNAVAPIITQSQREGKLPIVVGGTGFYLQALNQGIDTLHIPVNQKLRTQLSTLSLPELQVQLQTLAPERFHSMNHSDRHNPRRLIRALEVAASPLSPPHPFHQSVELIGLKYSDLSIQHRKIHERVLFRLDHGAIAESQSLLLNYGKNHQAMTAIGYRSIFLFLEHKLSRDELVAQWVTDEFAYAKRQLTWFRRDKSIQWYDIDKENYVYPKN